MTQVTGWVWAVYAAAVAAALYFFLMQRSALAACRRAGIVADLRFLMLPRYYALARPITWAVGILVLILFVQGGFVLGLAAAALPTLLSALWPVPHSHFFPLFYRELIVRLHGPDPQTAELLLAALRSVDANYSVTGQHPPASGLSGTPSAPASARGSSARRSLDSRAAAVVEKARTESARLRYVYAPKSPTVRWVSASDWDLVVVVALAYAAIGYLAEEGLDETLESSLNQQIESQLSRWDPRAPGLLDDCGAFFDRTYAILESNSSHRDSHDVIGYDALGLWITSRLRVFTPDEQKQHARSIGLSVTQVFANWWRS